MKKLAIKAENISKQYRLGEVGTGTLSHDLNRFWYKLRGQEDPYLKVGDSNDRTVKGTSDYVWSLRDINFEIEKGEAVGIIGRNGAGKSTLLKLLSKVTKPTTGNFKVNGRIASLLEVGTGFNPEMTGRENIYLNGAILGMRRHEISRKLDEIIDFSGVERYIDTPVKRYSSGMYVRLAFAVAAHLESEILIVDEVLAVGDGEFQKKCLGKMNDVSKGEGRTVLFVSHNIQAVTNLTTTGILLNKGTIEFNGNVEECIKRYIISSRSLNLSGISKSNRLSRTSGKVMFKEIKAFSNGTETWEFNFDEDIPIHFKTESHEESEGLIIYMALKHPFSGEIISNYREVISHEVVKSGTEFEFRITIPKRTLRPGEYGLYFALGTADAKAFHDVIDENVNFPYLNINPVSMDYHENAGLVSLPFNFELDG
jgi:lipopolysaccharide transport system ATP-binding protein